MTDYAAELLEGKRPADPQLVQTAGTDYAASLLGTAPTQPLAAPTDPNAEPDAPTWLGRRKQDIVGKQDPRYKDVPAFSEFNLNRFAAGLTTHDDKAYGDIVKGLLGPQPERVDDISGLKISDATPGRLVRTFKDANGYEIMEYKGTGADADKTFQAYVNKPGLDRFDVSRGLAATLPLVAAGGKAGEILKGAGLAARAAGQFVASGGTSLAQDAAAKAQGSEQGFDFGRAGLFGLAGAGGEVAGAMLKPLLDKMTATGLVKNGVLTPEGEAAVKAAGGDPAIIKGKLADEFGKTYAKTGDAAQAAMKANSAEFGIPTTIGQRTKRPDLLHTEEAMRRNIYGDAARQQMGAFDAAQQRAIDEAARGAVKPTAQVGVDELVGIAPQLAPKRELKPGKDQIGTFISDALQGAKGTAKAAEDAAWGKPIDAMARKEALDMLPRAIDSRLGGFTIDAQLTPASSKMADLLKSYQSGELQNLSSGVFGTNPRMATVDEMRRKLGGMLGTSANDTDRAAAKAIYGGFNDWIEQASQKSLLSGDAQAAANLRQAIDITREYRGLFNPRDATGRTTQGGAVLESLMKEQTPERIVQKLFGGAPVKSQAPPAGTVEALQRMKDIFQKYGPDPRTSINPWDDVRLAYWLKLVQDGKGEMLTPGNLVNNVKGAFTNQRSVLQTLYSPDEMRMMLRYANEVQKATYKPPNASGTSYGVAHFAKEFAATAGKAISSITGGWGDKIIFALLRPVANEYGRGMAGRATAQDALRRVPLGAAGYGAAAASAAGVGSNSD